MRQAIRAAVFLCLALTALSAGWPAARARAADADIRLAVVGSSTGDAAVSSQAMFQAARYAVEQINDSGGLLGRRVALWDYDNGSTGLGSRVAAEAAVSDGAVAVIGASWSAHSLAMAPICQAARVPMITPISTNPAVTRVGDYIFRCCYTDRVQGPVMARFARESLKARSAVIMVNVSRVYCTDLAGLFEKSFTRLGGTVVGQAAYTTDTANYGQLLETVRAADPDVLYVPGDYRDSSFIIRQARDMGLRATILGADAFGQRLYDYIGRSAEGCYYTTHWHRGSPLPRSRAFVARWEARYGALRQTTIPLTYDAVMLWADAVRRAGTVDGPAVRNALAASDFQGVTGRIVFGEHGDPRKAVIINRLEHGGTTFVRAVNP